MKLYCLLALAFLAFAPVARGQELDAHAPAQTSAPAESRFEIVQSNIAVMWTFKLDKYSGAVYQLVTNKNGDFTWELMDRDSNAANTIIVPGKVNYQIFTSGLAAKFTILMNVNSGASWLLTEDTKTKTSFWAVMPPR